MVEQQMVIFVMKMSRKSGPGEDESFPHCPGTETAPETPRPPKRLSHPGDAHESVEVAPELVLEFLGFHGVTLLSPKVVGHPASVTMGPEEEENATLAEKDMAPYELVVRPQGGPVLSRERT